MTDTTITLDGPTRAFTQGVADGSDLADAIPGDRDAWLFFAGRAFALRYGQDQQSAEAQAYVQGINLRKPEAPQAAALDDLASVLDDDILIDDLAERLTCSEVETLAAALRAAGRPGTADEWLDAHAEGDDEGDDHFRP